MTSEDIRQSNEQMIDTIDLLLRRIAALTAGTSEPARYQTLLGLARLLNSLIPHATHDLLAGRWIAVPVPGGRVFADLGDWTTLALMETSGWERPLLDACAPYVPPGGTALDVGAHSGSYTVFLAALVGSAGRVFAFEPLPDNIDTLERTIALNEVGAVARVEPVALSSAAGTANLFHYVRGSDPAGERYEHESSMLYSLVRAAGYERTGVTVPVVTLDGWAKDNQVECVDFVKIDAEGAEARILTGARRLIARSPRIALLVELHPAELAAEGASVADVVAELRGHSLDVHDLDFANGTLHIRRLAPKTAAAGTHLLAFRGARKPPHAGS